MLAPLGSSPLSARRGGPARGASRGRALHELRAVAGVSAVAACDRAPGGSARRAESLFVGGAFGCAERGEHGPVGVHEPSRGLADGPGESAFDHVVHRGEPARYEHVELWAAQRVDDRVGHRLGGMGFISRVALKPAVMSVRTRGITT